MFLVGQLSDKRMQEELEREYKKLGIFVVTEFNSDTHVYSLFVEQESDLPVAQDAYRLKLGFQKAPEIDPEWIKIKSLPRGQFTFQVIIVCVLIYLASFTQMGQRLYEFLFMGQVESGFLAEVKRGQIWRLITPIFLHLSLLHILFIS